MEKVKTNAVLFTTYILFASIEILAIFGKTQGATSIILGSVAAIGLGACVYLTITLDKGFRTLNERCTEQENITRNKELLLSLIIHDLKGPAQHISLLAQMINRGDLKSQDYPQLAKQIHNSANRHFELVNRLIEWTRMEVNLQEHATVCDVHEVTEEICNQYKSACEKKELTLMNYVDPCFMSTASKVVLQSVIGNMIHNSVKFTPGGGIITVSATKTMNGIEISVSDTGLGMTKESAEKLFSPGKRYVTAGTMNEKGSGIGLILCNELVKKAGGNIRVQSTPGKGSTFTFSLPIRQQANAVPATGRLYYFQQFLSTILS